MLSFSLSSLLLGIAFSAPPGVVTAAIRRGLTGGFWAAFLVELGSMAGDAIWAVIALSGGAVLVQNPAVQTSLGLAGAIFMLTLAILAFRDAAKLKVPEAAETAQNRDLVHGLLLSLGNPFSIAFWLSVGSTIIPNRIAHPLPFHYVLFFLTFMLGVLIWCFILAGLVSRGRKYLEPPFFRWVNILCGFAVQTGWNYLRAIVK
jgi:threonine/homoserine/homoserine lactone efflux protein